MLKKLGLGLLTLLVLVAIGLAVWEPLAATRAEAPPTHSYDVQIARDSYGVPHIFGPTDPDVAYGIAWAQAEDDFGTLQQVLAMTRGRMGAITGSDGAKGDFAGHLLDVRATVDRDYDAQPADVRALLDGYASGLNRYAETHGDEVALAKLFPLNGRDVAAGFVLRSPFFFGLDKTLGALIAGEDLPDDTGGPLTEGEPRVLARPVDRTSEERAENGSNAWVVAPSRSSDGYTRLVSNSHQPWKGPVAWYELVVQSGTGWHFAGANFPGTPYPLLGHNERLGWTNTVNRPDLIDVYKLKTDGDRYLYDGQWRTMESRRVWLPVHLWGPFNLPVPRTVKRAVQGPVVENDRGAFAVNYGGKDQMGMVESYYRLTRAQDWDEWQGVIARQTIPATNFLYADATGRIAYIYNAAFPNRRPGFDYRGMLPGDTSRAYTPGTVPYSAVPKIVNPASGFLINSNNTPWLAAGRGSEMNPTDWSPLLGVETNVTNRMTRALELMAADPSVSRAELARMKYDTEVSKRSWAGDWFGSLMLLDTGGDRRLADAQNVLRQWDWNYDGQGPADALAALLLRAGNKWHYQGLERADPRAALGEAADHLTKYFGRLDPPLGEVMRLRVGKVDVPYLGGPDVLRAASLWDVADDGRLVVRHGDSFLMFAEWSPAGQVRSWSIQPFGAAVSRPTSPHHSDQARLFAEERVKPVWFTRDQLKGHVERRYRPG